MTGETRATKRSNRRLVIGAMTGTSIDGVDVAAVEVRGRALNLRAKLLATASESLGELAPRLRAAQRQAPLTSGEFATLARDLALAHIDPIRELIARCGAPDLISLHGQTLFHAPPVSLQLIDASVVAHAFACTVVSNLRSVDLAAGGQGAPITPLADWMLFRSPTRWRVVVNLGGFANGTIVGPKPDGTNSPAAMREAWISTVRGFDICLCNQILDHICATRLGIAWDDGGRHALAGKVSSSELSELFSLLETQRLSNRSMGTRDEIVALGAQLLCRLEPDDALATAVRAIARSVAAAISQGLGESRALAPNEVLLAGGGARNAALVGELKRALPCRVSFTDKFAIPIDARESVAMAVLGCAALDGAQITLPSVTQRGQTRLVDGSFVHAQVALQT